MSSTEPTTPELEAKRAREAEELRQCEADLARASERLASARLRILGERAPLHPTMSVSGASGLVKIDLGTLVRWVSLGPTSALQLARNITRVAYAQKSRS